MLYREILKERDKFVEPMNQGLETAGGATPFSVYIQTYKRTMFPALAAPTQWRYASVINKHLVPAFGELMLRDLKPMVVQDYFSGLAGSGLSHSSMETIRSVLASIVHSAQRFQLLVLDPTESLLLPREKRGKSVKPWIRPEQVGALLALIAEPYQTMVYVALYTGLRFSELAGLKWGDVDRENLRITIDERCCRGDWSAPKSDASNATVPVNASVIARLDALRDMEVVINWGARGAKKRVKVVRGDGPENLVFQSLVKGAPMRDGNILRRHIHPAAEKLGIRANWQILRRSFGTSKTMSASGACRWRRRCMSSQAHSPDGS
jgi:integrase